MRHAAEIALLSYERLRGKLTELALAKDLKEGQLSPHVTEAFLDAWAFVDAVDRLRSLVRLMPGLDFARAEDAGPDFHAKTEVIRQLRNNPAGRSLKPPTGLIQLSAGEHTADLDEILKATKALIRDFEISLRAYLQENASRFAAPAVSDLILRLTIQFSGEDAPPAPPAPKRQAASRPIAAHIRR
jgi:hypothetical protein